MFVVTVNNNSPIQDYVHLDDQTQPTFANSITNRYHLIISKKQREKKRKELIKKIFQGFSSVCTSAGVKSSIVLHSSMKLNLVGSKR